MYELFRRRHPSFDRVRLIYPQLDYIRRQMKEQIKDVKHYYRLHPKRVDSQNILGSMLFHIPLRWDFDDQKYLRFVEDASVGVARAFGLTSSIYRGKVHEEGVTLGPKTNEVIISTYESIELNNFDKNWFNYPALKYLYHTRTDLGLPIMNNTTPGKGSGVAVLNIPLMALQYRYWLKYQSDQSNQKESVYRFIGMVVLPNAIESYLDIAIFNRLTRIYGNIGITKYPTPHPFYLTDYSAQIDKFCEWIISTQQSRQVSLERLVGETPMVIQPTLFEVMQLPKDPVTRHNEWALLIARLPYVRYLVKTGLATSIGDQADINDVWISIVEAERDNAFSNVGSSEIVKQYRQQIRELIVLIEQWRKS